MKQLPEKWAIKTDDPEFYKWFNELPNVDKGMGYYYGLWDRNSYIHYPHYNTCGNELCYSNEDIKNGFEEITIEQWRESVKYGWKELDHDTDSILPEDESKAKFIQKTGELEGYEAPYDIPFWDLKKGDIIIEHGKELDFFSNGSVIPKQVVRSWEKVYQAKEKKRVPKSGWVIQDPVENKTIFKDGEPFLIQAECIYWVEKNGLLGHYYAFLEVDYITEE